MNAESAHPRSAVGATIFLLVAATSGLMGALSVVGVDPFYGLLRTVYRMTGVLASGVGLALLASESLPSRLGVVGALGLALPWLGLFVR